MKWYAPVLTFAQPEGKWDDPEGVLDVHRLLGILALQDLVSNLCQFSILHVLWPTGNKLMVKFNMKYNYFSSDMVEDVWWIFHLMGMTCPNKIIHTELRHWHWFKYSSASDTLPVININYNYYRSRYPMTSSCSPLYLKARPFTISKRTSVTDALRRSPEEKIFLFDDLPLP